MTFDVPVALLELLYVRAALGLTVDDDMPSVSSPPSPRPAPSDAQERWSVRYDQVLDQLHRTGGQSSPGWLPELLTRPEDVDDGARWMQSQRRVVISSALFPDARNAPLLHRRGASLTGSDVTLVLVLPLDGRWCRRASDDVLLVSLPSFLDDRAWESIGP